MRSTSLLANQERRRKRRGKKEEEEEEEIRKKVENHNRIGWAKLWQTVKSLISFSNFQSFQLPRHHTRKWLSPHCVIGEYSCLFIKLQTLLIILVQCYYKLLLIILLFWACDWCQNVSFILKGFRLWKLNTEIKYVFNYSFNLPWVHFIEGGAGGALDAYGVDNIFPKWFVFL